MSDAHTHTFDNGALFIDRDPLHFRHILNYLRDGVVPLERSDNAQQLAEILREAREISISIFANQNARKNSTVRQSPDLCRS